MRCRYSLQVECACPNDDLSDIYDVVVEAERTIEVEKIIAFAESMRAEKMFQENLTVLMARTLNAKVTSVGWHYGVRTEVVV
jgi:NADPH-dependent 7-cyano-7-deazaguanine reductase QueF